MSAYKNGKTDSLTDNAKKVRAHYQIALKLPDSGHFL